MNEPGGADWTTAWSSALDDLELTLEQTERLLRGSEDPETVPPAPEPWTPPTLDAPLPPEMLERAQALVARQQQLILATHQAMSGNRRSNTLVRRIADASGVRRAAPSVYLDVRA